jgi:hypothetical protein
MRSMHTPSCCPDPLLCPHLVLNIVEVLASEHWVYAQREVQVQPGGTLGTQGPHHLLHSPRLLKTLPPAI